MFTHWIGVVFLPILFYSNIALPINEEINQMQYNLPNELLELSNSCKNLSLSTLIRTKTTQCSNFQSSPGSKQSFVECIMFYDINSQLCSAFANSKVDLLGNYTSNMNTTQNVISLCNDAQSWSATMPKYKILLEKIFHSNVKCLKLCTDSDIMSEDSNFYCKYYHWGSQMLSLTSQQANHDDSTVNIVKPETPIATISVQNSLPQEHVIQNLVLDTSTKITKDEKKQDLNSTISTIYNNGEKPEPVATTKSEDGQSKAIPIQVTENKETKEDTNKNVESQNEQQNQDVNNPIQPLNQDGGVQNQNQNADIPNQQPNPIGEEDPDSEMDEKDFGDDDPLMMDNENNVGDDPKLDAGQAKDDEPSIKEKKPQIGNEESVIIEGKNEDNDVRNDFKHSSDYSNMKMPFNEDNQQRVPEVYANQDSFGEEDDHFFPFFLTSIVFVVLLYILYHNKSKVTKLILGLIVEGRQTNRRRNSRGHAYRRLDTLEQAMSANSTAPPSKIIY